MSTQRNYKWINTYCLSKNNRVICSICDAIYVLTFSKSLKYHIIKWHNNKEDYKRTNNEEYWLWKFYNIGNNTIKCKFCKYCIPIDRERLLQHFREHEVNNSKANDLTTWMKKNLHLYYKRFRKNNKKQCIECGITYKKYNYFILMKHLLDDHQINIPVELIPKQKNLGEFYKYYYFISFELFVFLCTINI